MRKEPDVLRMAVGPIIQAIRVQMSILKALSLTLLEIGP